MYARRTKHAKINHMSVYNDYSLYLRINSTYLHGKNDFTEVSKNFDKYTFKNNSVELLKWLCGTLKHDKYAPKFDILITSVPRNYFHHPSRIIFRLISKLVATFLNISIKSFFSCGTGSKKRRMKGKESLIFSACLI